MNIPGSSFFLAPTCFSSGCESDPWAVILHSRRCRLGRVGVEKEGDWCADMTASHRNTRLVYPPTLLMSREINNRQSLQNVVPGGLETHCGEARRNRNRASRRGWACPALVVRPWRRTRAGQAQPLRDARNVCKKTRTYATAMRTAFAGPRISLALWCPGISEAGGKGAGRLTLSGASPSLRGMPILAMPAHGRYPGVFPLR